MSSQPSFDFFSEVLKAIVRTTVDTAAKATPEILENLQGKSLRDFVNHFRAGSFSREDLLTPFLFSQDFSSPRKTPFIDYSAYRNYYPHDKKNINLVFGNEKRTVELPYKEEINFVRQPNARIGVVGDLPEYKMPEDLRGMTEGNLQEFLKQKPDTFKGPNLRMASFKQLSRSRYQCRLEPTNYWEQVRTNLTVDYPLQGDHMDTLRLRDMNKDTRDLKPLEESLLVNTIGVSTVVYYFKDGYLYFFTRPRKGLGVFENVLGTVSGEVENPPESVSPKELTSYVAGEVKREFLLETGLNAGVVIKPNGIRLLAFTRELFRGGKPQFFFLIEIREVEDKYFSEKFKKSVEGMDEFYDDVFHKLRFGRTLSPEFAVNLVYAIQYLRVRQHRTDDPLILDTPLS